MIDGTFVVDVDSHVYEPEEIWIRYLPSEVRPAAMRAFWRQGDELVLNGSAPKRLNHAGLVRQAIWRPGMTVEEIGRLDPLRSAELNRGAWDAQVRLGDLDALGIDHQLILPTLFGEYFPAVRDPQAAAALARAYNDWVADFAGAGGGRLHPAAVLPLQDVEASLQEIEHVRELGLRAVALRPMFYRTLDESLESANGSGWVINSNGVYLLHPVFTPLWDALEEHGLVACVHPYLGTADVEGVSEGSFVERVSEKLGIGHTVAEPVAYMEDGAMFVVAAAFMGLFEDHPRLKLMLLHSGASMLSLALEKAETYLWLLPFAPTGQPPVSLEPGEVFERSEILVSFDGWESSAVRLQDSFLKKRAWGSRYPNHDASTPSDAIDLCDRFAVPGEVAKELLGGHAAELLGLAVPIASH